MTALLEGLRSWLLSVAACAVLASMAEQLCPEGVFRKAIRFAGGLALLLALLRPLGSGTPAEWPSPPSYREALAAARPELEEKRDEALRRGIASALETYIEDKALALGFPERVTVSEDVVTLEGEYSAELAGWLEGELGITKERQRWSNGEDCGPGR